MKLGTSFWTVLALVVITGISTLIVGELLFFRVMILWIGVILFSWLWTYYSLRGITLRRYSRDARMESGDFLKEIYEISNQSWIWKAWIEVTDLSGITNTSGSKILTRIGSKQIRSYFAYTQVYQRGFYSLGPTLIRSGDILGVFTRELRFDSTQNILVTPTVMEIDHLEKPYGYLPGGKALQRKSPETTPYDAGIREYSPGDPLNKIHWPSTARIRKIMVKEFDQDPQSDVYILLDLDQSIQWKARTKLIPGKFWMLDRKPNRQIQPASLDYLSSIAASIAKHYLDRQHAVGTIWREESWQFLAADKGDRQLIKILEALALVHGGSDLGLDTVLDFQSRYLPRGSLLWLITPVASQSLIKAAELARMRGLKVHLIALDPSSFGENIPSLQLDEISLPVRIIHASSSISAIQVELQGE